MKTLEICVKDLEKEGENRKLFFHCCPRFDVKSVGRLKLERAFRKDDVDSIPDDIQSELVCNICGKVVLSFAGCASQLRSHENQLGKSLNSFKFAGEVFKFLQICRLPEYSSRYKCRVLISGLCKFAGLALD